MEADRVALRKVALKFEAAIRPATEDDLPKLEWFGQHWRFRKVFQNTYRDQLQGRRLMLVADVNDFPVGQLFIQFHSIEFQFADGYSRAYVYSVRVLTPFQQRGLGTQLMLAGEEAIRARSYDWATIAVAKTNEGALRLYKRLGYSTFTDDPGRWSFADPDGKQHRVDEPCWVMQKRLT